SGTVSAEASHIAISGAVSGVSVPPSPVGTSSLMVKNVVLSAGSGFQNQNATLATPASFGFSEGFAFAFRTLGNNFAGVKGDMLTTPTSLIVRATGVPAGVTITWPNTLSNAAVSTPNTQVTFTLRGGATTCTGLGGCIAIYDTSSHGPGLATLQVD